MSRFKTKPTVLTSNIDGISKSISIRLENAIDAARHAGGLWMQPQYLACPHPRGRPTASDFISSRSAAFPLTQCLTHNGSIFPVWSLE